MAERDMPHVLVYKKVREIRMKKGDWMSCRNSSRESFDGIEGTVTWDCTVP